MIPTVAVTRYVTPLREGGSLPGIVEGDDLGTYVCKFRGAGQGLRVLVAEVIVGELARRIGLRTPRLVALDLDPEIARYEADEEVQDLLNASPGLNLGIDFLPGAFGYDGDRRRRRASAARVLWLDAFTANVDRSWRNPNLLVWHGDLWVIDHGAALYFHHAWAGGVTDPGAVRRTSRGAPTTTCSAPTRTSSRPPTSEIRGVLESRRVRRGAARGARRVARAGARRRDAGRAASGVRRASCPPGSATRQWLPEVATA